jgi:WD40 repeat protein
MDEHPSVSISNILYTTKIYRNPETAFRYNLEADFKTLSEAWNKYYLSAYQSSDNEREEFKREQFFYHKKKRKKNIIIDQLCTSSDGKYIAYATNDEGKFKVWLKDTKTGKVSHLITREYKKAVPFNLPGDLSTDPILRWHPDNKLLAMAYQYKGQSQIHLINVEAKEKDEREEIIPMYKYERVLDFNYSSDGRQIALSAIKNGRSDIFVFDILSRRDERITDDAWNDINPVFSANDQEILFSSNRTTIDMTEKNDFVRLPLFNNYDLFAYSFENRFQPLRRITQTPFNNETQAYVIDSTFFTYLSDQSGISNRLLSRRSVNLAYSFDTTIGFIDTTIKVYVDSFITVPVTDFKRNVLVNKPIDAQNTVGDMVYIDGYYRALKNDFNKLPLNYTPNITAYKNRKNGEDISLKRRIDTLQLKLTNALLDTNLNLVNTYFKPKKRKYFFQTEFTPFVKPQLPDEKDTTEIENKTAQEIEKYKLYREQQMRLVEQQLEAINLDTVQENFDKKLNELFKANRARTYLPLFSTTKIVSEFNNALLNDGYQLFTGSGPVYNTGKTNGLIKVSATDLMEDYLFTGGFRLDIGSVTIPEYFISFEDRSKRIDKSIMYYRQGNKNKTNYPYFNLINNEVRGALKYPFSEIAAVKLTGSARMDLLNVYGSDEFLLQFPSPKQYTLGLRGEYIFDNSLEKGSNLYNGTRGRAFIEQYKTLDTDNGNMTNIGFDVRHYEKIHRQVIASFRLSGASSISGQKVMYYMGGLDGWLFPQFNDKIKVDDTYEYQYHALTGNVRGFSQNIRNGNSNLVFNTDVRFPVIQYFSRRPLRSEFARTFQLVPFLDIGTAWVGADPWSEVNKFNRLNITSGNITVTVKEPKSLLVAGYGMGVRAKVLGYFVHFDWAWGINNGRLQTSVRYLSFNLDF